MLDPDPQNLNHNQIPPRGSDEVIHTKRSTRNQAKDSSIMNKHSRISISKSLIKSGVKSNKMVLFKAGKGSDSLKVMEEDEEFDGDLESNTYSDSQSIDLMTCGELVSELQAELEKELVSELIDESVKVNSVSGVVKNASLNGNSVGSDVGPIPIPVSENPILNPNRSKVNSPSGSLRILRRGEVLTDGGNIANATFSFNQVEKWPKRTSVDKGSCPNSDGMNVDESVVMNDKVMKENVVEKRNVSFRNVVQGLGQYGNNKLRLIPGRINEKGKQVADMDPLLEEGSKA
ncbi:hypothetical protein Tco_1421988 [Tanacetum coccineum]